MKKYETKQRKLLAEFLRENCENQYTVGEIAEILCKGNSISVSAIYRNIDALVADGTVKRFTGEDGRDLTYQYICADKCSGHLHLKCMKCGHIVHMDDSATEKIVETALETNSFHVNERDTILYGVCEECAEEEDKKQ